MLWKQSSSIKLKLAKIDDFIKIVYKWVESWNERVKKDYEIIEILWIKVIFFIKEQVQIKINLYLWKSLGRIMVDFLFNAYVVIL